MIEVCAVVRLFRQIKSFSMRGTDHRVFCLLLAGIVFLNPGSSGTIPTTSSSAVAVAANPARTHPATRTSIQRGLAWLVSTIRRDGTVGTDAYQPPDLACTAIVGLTLLAEGSSPRGGQYSQESRRVLYGVLDLVNQRPLQAQSLANVTLVQRKIGINADLFFATLYLSEVYFESPGDEVEIRKALERMISHICRVQGPDGTWGDESWAPILGTVMGWVCLRSASSAGFEINASAKLVGEALIKKLKSKSLKSEESWMHSLYKDCSSLRVLYSMNYRDDPAFLESVNRVLELARTDSRPFEQAGGEEYLAFYLVTECLLKEPRKDWQAWYPNVRDHLVKQQNGDGSWSGHHCITDRTFCTAAALLTLLSTNGGLTTSEL